MAGTGVDSRADKLRQAKKESFLESYAACGIITKAAEAAGIARDTFYEWCNTDDQFSAAADQALAASVDGARAELRRRAIDGWEEPVWYKGELAGTVRKFSDVCLIFLLKHADPTYRERHDVNVSGEVEHTHHLDAASLDGLVERFESFKARAIETTATET